MVATSYHKCSFDKAFWVPLRLIMLDERLQYII